jgi:O-antigen ligase
MFLFAILFTILAAGILSMWVPSRWPLTLFQLAILLLAAVRIVSRRGVGFNAGAAAVAGIALWGAVQYAAGWTVDPFRTSEEILHFTVAVAAFALAAELDSAGRDRFLAAAVFFAAGIGLVAIVTAFLSPADDRVFGPFVYRNQLAAFMECLLPAALLRAFRHRAWVFTACAGLMFASVVAAGSRTGTVLVTAELIVVPLLAARQGVVSLRALTAAGAGIAASVAALTLAVGWQPLWNRFQEPNPFGLRWDLLQSSWQMFLARPLTGWGLGAWPIVYPGYARYDDGTFVNQAHNDWAQWAVEGGIPVFSLMLFLAVRATVPACRRVWSTGMVAVLLHAMVDYPFQQRPQLAAFFFVMLSLAASDRDTQATLTTRPA